MAHKASHHQLAHLVDLLSRNYQIYAPVASGKNHRYQKIEKFSEIAWGFSRTVLPIKKIIFPNHQEIIAEKSKVALIGLPLCDVAAVSLLLKQFSGSKLIRPREDILIVAGDCTPDDKCFCDQFNLHDLYDYDLYIAAKGKDFLVKANTWRGQKVVANIALKETTESIILKPKTKSEKIDLEKTKVNIGDKQKTHDFWNGIANNCFGCGACTTVCPLCFCFDQEFENQADGSCSRCANWTSCFSADFSQIQFGNDLRPENTDRLYNWYHHKFVRGPRELGHPLCVGCGRCISACPAHLNIKSIISSLNKKYG